MTILPLVERELRVRARSPAGYWTRFAAALAGTLLCVFTLTVNANQTLIGTAAFDGLVVAAFILCCFSGFLTLDGIGRERREGTLGLLFLTRVKALDVLLGNFGAAGIASLCALAAFVPVLVVPVLAGGVSGGEAARKGLALFDMMILSLAVGLWASARGRAWWSSARSAAWVLALVIFIPQLLGTPFLLANPSQGWCPGPLSALSAAGDVAYRKSAAPYWRSIAVVHAISWLLLISAGFRLRQAWRQEDVSPADSVRLVPRRKRLAMGQAPLEWLVRRQRGIRFIVWAGVLLRTSQYNAIWFFIAFNRMAWLRYYSWGAPLAFAIVENCLFAWAASRFFVEARRTGELELLMTTPEGARTIVSSQWQWLKKVFCWPLVVMIVPWGLLRMFVSRGNFTSFNFLLQLFAILYSALLMVAGVAALLWVGMWFGWSERSQARAIVRTVLVTQAVPFLVVMLHSKLVVMFWTRNPTFNSSNP